MLTGPDDPNRLDRVVCAAAAAMALHCLAAAQFAAVFPALTGAASHRLLAATTALLSVIALIHGWLLHHDLRVAVWAAPGWALLALARFSSGASLSEFGDITLTLTAAALLIVAHQLNRSLAYWQNRI